MERWEEWRVKQGNDRRREETRRRGKGGRRAIRRGDRLLLKCRMDVRTWRRTRGEAEQNCSDTVGWLRLVSLDNYVSDPFIA
ncbi:hypothetical protein BHE74_00024816 [Ensete ventricosum]|nr:hypothetical protein GW17_00035054 [Ensete ventricosum]RWW67713.1 hypothetical protein BHE74_00024816 [Ensete ventricosum]